MEAGRLARELGKVEYRHVKRAHNELADKLVNDALDAAERASSTRSASPSRRETTRRRSRPSLPDVVFRSPAVHQAYEGRDTVAALLHSLVGQTFENFRYTQEWRDGNTTILFFEANVGNRELQGVDILEDGDDGLVEEFTVMVRPLSGLQALAGAVAARLGIA